MVVVFGQNNNKTLSAKSQTVETVHIGYRLLKSRYSVTRLEPARSGMYGYVLVHTYGVSHLSFLEHFNFAFDLEDLILRVQNHSTLDEQYRHPTHFFAPWTN